jgi:hypothetical protein
MNSSLELLAKLAQSNWFFVFLLFAWLLASAVFARLSGLRSLGRQFRASSVPAGQSFRFSSATFGSPDFPIGYRNCLHVVIGESGLYARLMFPFNFQSPAVLLPWTAVESVTEKQSFFTRTVTIRLRGQWPVVKLKGALGQLAKAAHEKATASP